MSLKPVPSPYLVNGELSEKAKRGRKVYEKFNCDECHSGPYYTDMKMHRIGEDIEFENGWDTPTLREVWRTAPYLFDGQSGKKDRIRYIAQLTKKVQELLSVTPRENNQEKFLQTVLRDYQYYALEEI